MIDWVATCLARRWTGQTLPVVNQTLREAIKAKHVANSASAQASKMSKGMRAQRGKNRVAREKKRSRGAQRVSRDTSSRKKLCVVICTAILFPSITTARRDTPFCSISQV